MVRKFTTIALVALAAALSAASASAAVRTGSVTFNPNNPTPSFNPGPQRPLITITTSYDDAGTVTLTENGFQHGDEMEVSLHDGQTAEAYLAAPLCDTCNQTTSWGAWLSMNGVGGSLPANITFNVDGSVTAVFASSMLANQGYTYLTFGSYSDAFGWNGAIYFAGYEPTVSIANPGSQSAVVGTPVSLQMNAYENGVSRADSGGITSITAVNLPPGLKMDRTGRITGTPTQAGTGTTTVTATGAYNNGSQSTSASVTFAWTVTNPPPPAPVISTWVAAPQTVAQLTRMANAHHVIGFSARTERLRPVRVTNAGRKNGIDKWAWGLITPKAARSARSARVGSKGILFKHQHGQWRVVAGGGVPTHCPPSVFGAFEPRD